MAVEFACPGCGQTLRMGDEFAGKQARCPGCRQVVFVPHERTAPQAAAGGRRPRQAQERPLGPVPRADSADVRSAMDASKQPAGAVVRTRSMAWVCIAGGGVLLALLVVVITLIFWRVQRDGPTPSAPAPTASSAETAEPKPEPPTRKPKPREMPRPKPPADTPTPVARPQPKPRQISMPAMTGKWESHEGRGKFVLEFIEDTRFGEDHFARWRYALTVTGLGPAQQESGIWTAKKKGNRLSSYGGGFSVELLSENKLQLKWKDVERILERARRGP